MELMKALPSDLTNVFSIEIGDWSRDGHNQSEVFMLTWDGIHPGDDINALFQNYLDAGAEKIGFSITETLCDEYEDSTLPIRSMQRIYDVVMEARLNFPIALLYRHLKVDLDDSTVVANGQVDTVQDFVYLVYLQACIGANAILPIRIISRPSIKCGGYGLFSCG